MPPISQILVTSSDFVLDTKQNQKGIPQFKENQILEAKVLKILSEGKAQLLIQGEKIVAKTHVPLLKNDTIKLKVVKTGENQILKMVEADKGSALPPGMGEVRVLGRAGPYAKLAQIFNDLIIETPAPQQIKGSLSTPGSIQLPDVFSEIKTIKEFFDHPVLKSLLKESTATEEKSVLPDVKLPHGTQQARPAAQGPTSETALLKSFVLNKNISWEHKAAAILSTRPEQWVQTEASPSSGQAAPAVLEKSFQKFEAGLLEVLKKNIPPEQRTQLENPSVKINIPEKLGNISKYLAEKLLPEEKVLMDSVVKKSSIPWDYKMLSVLFAAKKNSPQAGVIQRLQGAVFSRLLEAGPSVPIEGETTEVPQLKLPAGHENIRKVQVFKQLQRLLDIVAFKPEQTPDASSLKAMIKSSGLMWENKLTVLAEPQAPDGLPLIERAENLVSQDIKALAMKLAALFEGEEGEIGKAVKSFVDGLEKMQILNQHVSDESGRYLLPLPFLTEATLKFGQLFIDLDQKKEADTNGKERVISVAFILEMSRLGHLRADFSIYKKSISGMFGVESKEVKQLVDSALPLLKANMLKKDYVINKIGCSVISPEVLAVTSLTDMVNHTGEGLLNIVI